MEKIYKAFRAVSGDDSSVSVYGKGQSRRTATVYGKDRGEGAEAVCGKDRDEGAEAQQDEADHDSGR